MRSDERGYATILALGLSMVAFAVTGLAVDGTRAFLLRRTLQNIADSAALAGASEIDAASFYKSGGDIELDEETVVSTSLDYARERPVSLETDVRVVSGRVTVTVASRSPTLFLRLLGIGSLTVAARADAAPVVPRD